MSGFRESTLEVLDVNVDIPEEIPLVIDDWTLAFRLGFSGKFLWHTILHPEQMYEVFKIPKATGGFRVIHDPRPPMKRMCKRLRHMFLSPLIKDLPECVSAYRLGRSTLDAARQHVAPCEVCAPLDAVHTCAVVSLRDPRHAEYIVTRQGKENCNACMGIPKHVCPRDGTKLKLDLKDFFHSTRRSWIRQYFSSKGYNHYTAGLLAGLMTVPIKKFNGKDVFGVPQGSPVSGDICNLVAHERLDKLLLKWLPKGWKYTRYADDLYFSQPHRLTYAGIEDGLDAIKTCISEAGYRTNHKKTRVQTSSARQQVLGVVINDKMTMPRQKYRRLRAMLHNVVMRGFEANCASARKENASQLYGWFKGVIRYYKRMDPFKAELLEKRLELAAERYAHELGTATAGGEGDLEVGELDLSAVHLGVGG